MEDQGLYPLIATAVVALFKLIAALSKKKNKKNQVEGENE